MPGLREAAAHSRSKNALSRLSTQTPPGSRPSKISALASATASSDGKYAIWAASTLVTTATSGRIRRASGAISPAWFIPTSNTPKAASRGMRASDSGTPHRLL